MCGPLGCDLAIPPPDDESRSFDRPAVVLRSVLATGSYDPSGRPLSVPLSESAITEGIEPSSSFRLSFDRWLLPYSVIRQSVCLRPSSEPIESIEQCQAPQQPFAEPEYDPVGREVTYRLPPGARLLPGTLYRLTVLRSEEADSTAIRAFDGAALDRSYSFDLRTKADLESARDEPAPGPDRYCAVQACFAGCAQALDPSSCRQGCAPDCLDAACSGDGELVESGVLFGRCAAASCHGGAGSGPAMGLALHTATAISATAIGHVAHQTQTGEGAAIAQASGLRFGRAMPLVDPSNPGNSYLVYKLLANRLSYPPELLAPQLCEEIERLRASVVVGLAMPAQSAADGPDGTIDPDAVRLVSRWIAHGAVLSCP